MSTFSQLQTKPARKAPGFVILEPHHYVAEYPNVPRTPVAVGVFPISEHTLQIVMAEAAKDARLYYPDADADDPLINKHFDEALMKLAVARGTCDPNDVTKSFFAQPDDEIGDAWRPDTIRRVWDKLEEVTISTSAVVEPATDEELTRLSELMAEGLVSLLSSSQELRLRKLLRFCLDELEAIKELA